MIFLNGNIDVVTRILEFVAESSEELNTCAMISRSFRLARENPRFDQTRTGTIIFKTPLGNIPMEVWRRWGQQVFTGNRVRLVAILTGLPRGPVFASKASADLSFALTNVRELILQRDSSVKVPESLAKCGGVNAVRIFQKILPNLDILDIGALAVTTSDLTGTIGYIGLFGNVLREPRASVFHCTADVVYRDCHFSLLQPNPFPVNYILNNLREIHIDPFGVHFHAGYSPIAAYCQEYSQLEQEEWFENGLYLHDGPDWVLLQEYPNLERVTLLHAEYTCHDSYNLDRDLFWQVLPQEALMKFVRHTPTLRWFRSDLTAENIAILKEERAEVEFCD
jgi:hypothetical protein